jgi:AraC family transcriptional regulator
MQYLQTGSFLGQINKMITLENIAITESEYAEDKIDWHYHENAYFTFILSGKLLDGNKMQEYHCSPGTLLFHNWQDPHYNIMHKTHAKSLHIELQRPGADDNLLNSIYPRGRMNIEDPSIKILFYQIYKETKVYDHISAIEIESLFLKAADKMISKSRNNSSRIPQWVNKIKDILYCEFSEKITLKHLANEAGIHPVHLSRYFSKYFHSSLGTYIRKTRIERALTLLMNKNRLLTEIAFDCGFADQSHFLRCFKQIIGITPSEYRKIILR